VRLVALTGIVNNALTAEGAATRLQIPAITERRRIMRRLPGYWT
jgi:hypothetical protein